MAAAARRRRPRRSSATSSMSARSVALVAAEPSASGERPGHRPTVTESNGKSAMPATVNATGGSASTFHAAAAQRHASPARRRAAWRAGLMTSDGRTDGSGSPAPRPRSTSSHMRVGADEVDVTDSSDWVQAGRRSGDPLRSAPAPVPSVTISASLDAELQDRLDLRQAAMSVASVGASAAAGR